MSCGTLSTNGTPFHFLEIPLKAGTQTMQEAFDNYLVLETTICSECHQLQNIQSIEVTATPPTLCLHFLR